MKPCALKQPKTRLRNYTIDGSLACRWGWQTYPTNYSVVLLFRKGVVLSDERKGSKVTIKWDPGSWTKVNSCIKVSLSTYILSKSGKKFRGRDQGPVAVNWGWLDDRRCRGCRNLDQATVWNKGTCSGMERERHKYNTYTRPKFPISPTGADYSVVPMKFL